MAWGKEWAKTDSGKAFLDVFANDMKDRQKRTDAAQQAGSGSSSSKEKDDDKATPSGMTKLAPDINLQRGYRRQAETIEGTPGKKGFAGTLIRGTGAAFGGPFGAMAGNVAADATGADYW
jgi:hypothetical protein